jgi:hypothetical protein
MPLLNHSTEMPVERTVSEIQHMLGRHGAKAIMLNYDDQGTVSSLSFQISVNGRDVAFRLPCDWRPVLEILKNDPKSRKQARVDQARAVRVAWRIIKDWLEAQMALIDTYMVEMPEVFLPYAITKGGKTLYETTKESGFLLNGGGAPPSQPQ